MSNEIPSPCMKICVFDSESGLCLCCSRTPDEVEKWGLPDTTNEWKIKNLQELKQREQ